MIPNCVGCPAMPVVLSSGNIVTRCPVRSHVWCPRLAWVDESHRFGGVQFHPRVPPFTFFRDELLVRTTSPPSTKTNGSSVAKVRACSRGVDMCTSLPRAPAYPGPTARSWSVTIGTRTSCVGPTCNGLVHSSRVSSQQSSPSPISFNRVWA